MATAAAIVGAAAAVGGVVQADKAADDAIDAQEDQNSANKSFLASQAKKAKRDILPLFDAAQTSRELGAQGALDVLGQTIPQQLSAFQGGNVAAQQALLAGLPQMQNALLGLPTDLSGLQTFQPHIGTSFAQQQVPDFIKGAENVQTADARRQLFVPDLISTGMPSPELTQLADSLSADPSLTTKQRRTQMDAGALDILQKFLADNGQAQIRG